MSELIPLIKAVVLQSQRYGMSQMSNWQDEFAKSEERCKQYLQLRHEVRNLFEHAARRLATDEEIAAIMMDDE